MVKFKRLKINFLHEGQYKNYVQSYVQTTITVWLLLSWPQPALRFDIEVDC